MGGVDISLDGLFGDQNKDHGIKGGVYLGEVYIEVVAEGFPYTLHQTW